MGEGDPGVGLQPLTLETIFGCTAGALPQPLGRILGAPHQHLPRQSFDEFCLLFSNPKLHLIDLFFKCSLDSITKPNYTLIHSKQHSEKSLSYQESSKSQQDKMYNEPQENLSRT